MNLEYLETIFVLTSVTLNPMLIIPLISSNSFSGGAGVIELGAQILSPASLIERAGATLGMFINEIWSWILFNILSPIIIIVGLIVFIALQMALIYIYYKLVKEIILRIITLWGSVSENETLQKTKNKIQKIISG